MIGKPPSEISERGSGIVSVGTQEMESSKNGACSWVFDPLGAGRPGYDGRSFRRLIVSEPDNGSDELPPSSSSRSERLPKIDLGSFINAERTESHFEGTPEPIRIELSTLERWGATSSCTLRDGAIEGA